MAHDVFVSHSTKDKVAADAVVAHLEQDGLRCWVAPRDIQPGTSWPTAIMNAIVGSKVMVIVFSRNANESDHIRREVERAVSHGIPVVPVRIEDVMPAGDLEYFLSSSHWMDAISKPVERHFDSLAAKLKGFVDVPSPTKPTAAATRARAEYAGRRSPVLLIAFGSVALIALAVGGYLFLRHSDLAATPVAHAIPDTNDKASLNTIPTPTPSPTPLPTPTPAAKSTLPPMHLPPSVTKLGNVGVSIAHDNAIFQAISLVKWDNSFFLDNGPARFAEWKRAADAGDATAAFFVAGCYAEGAGVPYDDSIANAWFGKAIDGGNTDALVWLGNRALFGVGMPSSPALWNDLERRAVAKGNIFGMAVLGGGLVLGGQPADRDQGLRFVRRAAEAGSLDARLFIAFQTGGTPAAFFAEADKLAALGQPDAALMVANAAPQDQTKVADAVTALQMFGLPLQLQSLIDPPPLFPFNTSGIFTKPAWQRLRAMADTGYVEAQRTIDRMKQKGFVDPTGG